MAPIDYSKNSPQTAGTAAQGPVSLTKRGEQVSLVKGGGGAVRFNLNWTQAPANAGGGLFKRRAPAGIDLDLGCLYELADGSKGVVQALGNRFGSLDDPPFVKLDKDDRSGSATDGENLLVSETHGDKIRRLAVFAFIYEGAPNWSQAGGIVTIHPPAGAPITIELNETQDGMTMCSICLVERGPAGFSVSRDVQYLSGHTALDQQHGWGLRWTSGRK